MALLVTPITHGGNQIAHSAVSAPPYHVVVMGDSITAGSAVGGVGANGWPALVWRSLQAEGVELIPQVSGEGGSGYVQRGPDGTVFGEEALRLVRPDDNVIVFFGSRNDAPKPIDAISAAAHEAFANARRVAPNATLIVIGPITPDPSRHDAVMKIRDVMHEQAVEAGAVWIDPIAENWLSTPGLIGYDGRHPTNDGHQELAGRIAPIIKSALGL
jgi:lysophospholipase L1-like esterase